MEDPCIFESGAKFDYAATAIHMETVTRVIFAKRTLKDLATDYLRSTNINIHLVSQRHIFKILGMLMTQECEECMAAFAYYK